MPTTELELDIHSHYPLSEEQIQFFRGNGYIKLKNVLAPELLAHYGEEITRKVVELNTLHLPMEERTTYQKSFLQVENIWRESEIVKEFVFSKRVGCIAAELMGVSGVRLYHDQALYKEAGGGFTPWHVDQQYWPLSTIHTCTAWIPLQETPLEMGPVEFSAKSHKFEFGRDLPISDESEAILQKALKEANFKHIAESYELGEVSFHYGWTIHRAGPNTTSRPREAMTIIYMDENMRLKEPSNQNQRNDWNNWCPGAKVREVINTPLNPVIYSKR